MRLSSVLRISMSGVCAMGMLSAEAVAQDKCVDLQLIGAYGENAGGLHTTSAVYHDGHAYLLASDGLHVDLQVVDLHDPTAPLLVASHLVPVPVTGVRDVVVSDGVLYMPITNGRLIRLRLDDGVILPEYRAASQISTISVGGDTAYIGFYDSGLSDSGGIEIVDFSDDDNPVQLVLNMFDPNERHGGVVDLDVDGSVLYVTHKNLGLIRYGVADPAHPENLGSYMLAGGEYASLMINGGVGYLATAHEGIEGFLSLDINDPFNVSLVGTSLHEIPVRTRFTEAVESELIALSYRSYDELRIIDITDQQFPQEIFVTESRFDVPAFIDEQTLLLMSPHGLRVYDLSAGFGGNCLPPEFHPCDMDRNEELNWHDLSQFLEAYLSGEAEADLNGDGQLDRFDVSVFIQCYNAYRDQ